MDVETANAGCLLMSCGNFRRNSHGLATPPLSRTKKHINSNWNDKCARSVRLTTMFVGC